MFVNNGNASYDAIKKNLESCETKEDYINAYKWLANLYVEANESAINFEKKVEQTFGKEGLGIVLYGSREAYEEQKAFEEKIGNATETERYNMFLDKVFEGDDKDVDDDVEYDLWADENEER